MEGDGLRAEGEFLFLFGLCRERLENRVLETALVSCCSAHENHEGGKYDIMIHDVQTGRTLVVSGCWISFLMSIFAFKSAKVEVWFPLEYAPEQLVSVVTAERHCHVFPVVSELDYLLLEHVVFSDNLDFCLWEMLQQGGS